MSTRRTLLFLFMLAFLLPFIGKLGAMSAAQKTEKQPPKNQASKCLEQNVEAAGDDTALPCVAGGASTSASPATPQPTVAPPLEGGEHKLVRELRAYKSGYFLHPEALKFSELLSQEIITLNQTGHKVELIVITGQADGGRNNGVPKGREAIPDSCAHIAQNSTINDEELAKLRGCAMWVALSGVLAGKALAGFGWDPSPIRDIEDGGPSGPPYRKVVVEVIYE
jgi:hypothetical protein